MPANAPMTQPHRRGVMVCKAPGLLELFPARCAVTITKSCKVIAVAAVEVKMRSVL